jgi:tetratricopeptide (TPR) repeat protein
MKTLLLSLLVAGAVHAAKWADRNEYDLALTVRAEAAPQKRLALLDQWKNKYPASEFQQARRELYLGAYLSLGDSERMLGIAREILAAEPDDVVGLYWCTLLIPEARQESAEFLALGEKAAARLLELQKQTAGVEFLAHRALGWIRWRRGEPGPAEQEFQKCLELDPNAAEISAWRGTMLAQSNEPEKRVRALWDLARAASYGDAGALPEGQRRQLGVVLERLYTSYHGEGAGLDQVRTAAAAAVVPPPGFDIESAAAAFIRKQDEELNRTDPQLAAWVRLRRKLESPAGDQYMAELRNTPLPRLKGTLVRWSPPDQPSELTIAVVDRTTPEIVVKLAKPFPNEAEVGAALQFSGAIESFSRTPFSVTVLAEPEDISGWPPPPARRRK